MNLIIIDPVESVSFRSHMIVLMFAFSVVQLASIWFRTYRWGSWQVDRTLYVFDINNSVIT